MTRKRCNRKVWPLVNTLAHAREGAAIISDEKLRKLQLLELSAIDAFATGRATRDDWCVIADMANVAETMALDGIGKEALPSVKAVNAALTEAHGRHSQGKTLGLTGPGLVAVRDLREYADLQRTAVSCAALQGYIEKTANRIRSAHPSLKVVV